MSEIKRVPLMSFGADKGEEKKQKLVAKTVRIPFILPESNEGTCPVYNYKEELAAAKKKKDRIKPVSNGRPANGPNGLDPFDDDDDNVRRIAQEMEAKYGMPAKKKPRKGRKDDYADIGMGYDESDSFIDNTDGYDEMIPQNVTTLHGGFYINCGALEFKTDEEASSEVSSSSSSSSSEDEDDATEKTSRKRILETSDSEGDFETDKDKVVHEKKQKIENMSNGIPTIKKKKLLTPDKIKHLKKNTEENRKKSVKELLKEKREEVNVIPPAENKSVEKTEKGDIMKENKKPVTLHNISDIIESVVKGTENNNRLEVSEKEIVNIDVPVTNLIQKPVLAPTDVGENSIDSNNEQKTEIVQLPENLPDIILELINKLKATAVKNSENNLKVFTSDVNTLLLSLERKCRCLGKQSKSKIYQHLGPFLKSRKESLIRRAKALVIQDDTKKMEGLVRDLKSKIDIAMPLLMAAYEKESQKIVQKKESIEVEENKQLRMPKRKFLWPEDIKKIFKEIVGIRRRCFMIEGKSKEDVDIQMNIYLKTDIQILWPDGWMSMAALLKVYNNLGEKQSLPMPKPITKEVQKPQNNVAPPPPAPKINKDAPGVKEMQKLATNSMLSITPITSKPVEMTQVKPQKSDLTINVIDNDRLTLPIEISKNSGLSISPKVPDKIHADIIKATIEDISVIKPVTIDPIPPKPEVKPEKTTTFINLPQNSNYNRPENLSIKPTKPPTDHKIENIIKPSKAESLKVKDIMKADILPIPQNLTTPKHENLIKHKIESIPKPKSDNLLNSKTDYMMNPKPEDLVMKSKPESLPKSRSEPIPKSRPENLSKPKPENLSKPKHESLSKSKHDNHQHKLESIPRIKTDPKPELKRADSTDDVIILDDASPEMVQPEDKMKSDQVIDLTAPSELRRKPGPKSKTKYYNPSMIKPVKSALALEDKVKITGDSVLDNILQDNRAESEHYYNSLKKARNEMKDMRGTSNVMLSKSHNDGDDIQKVMEDLKVLQKMSTPMKNSDSVTSSPVSVIAFNKSYAPKTSTPNSSVSVTPKLEAKSDYAMGFQDAFQRQFLNEIKNSLAASQNNPTSSKSFNSAHSSSSSSHQEKYYTNSNNNYAQQNSNKYKTNYTTQQQGTFNLMDDMLANFITEYAYPKTANHKPKPPQK